MSDEINHGDLIIHRDYGIGKFGGIEKISTMGAQHECLKIIYSGQDKIFLPVENISLITRYKEKEDVALDKLGSKNWQLRKAKIKKHIKLIADQLIRTAAVRKKSDQSQIRSLSASYDGFCQSFEYTETEDQKQAIFDIEKDFESGKLMERLICGDTGFGKTEVAMRCAFLFLDKEKENQVAVVAPTTLLAKQHTEVFEKRMSSFGFKAHHISRLTPKKQVDQIKKKVYCPYMLHP